MALLDPLFGAAAMDEVFADNARLQYMLDFEAALANAQAQCGVIPSATARVIASKCKANLLDADALANATALCPTPACNVPITSLNQLLVPAGALGDFFGPGTTVGIPFAAQLGVRVTF